MTRRHVLLEDQDRPLIWIEGYTDPCSWGNVVRNGLYLVVLFLAFVGLLAWTAVPVVGS